MITITQTRTAQLMNHLSLTSEVINHFASFYYSLTIHKLIRISKGIVVVQLNFPKMTLSNICSIKNRNVKYSLQRKS